MTERNHFLLVSLYWQVLLIEQGFHVHLLEYWGLVELSGRTHVPVRVSFPYGSNRPSSTPMLSRLRWLQFRAYIEPTVQSIRCSSLQGNDGVIPAQSMMGAAYVSK